MKGKTKPCSRVLTSTYKTGYNLDRLLCATHWVCPVTLEQYKIPLGCKILYQYRLSQYKWFKSLGKIYHESNKTVADTLGISKKSIDDNYTPLLKRMGLFVVDSKNPRKPLYYIYDLGFINGWLINDKLQEHHTELSILKKEHNKEKFTYENMKTLEHNKSVAKRLKVNIQDKMHTITDSEFKEFLKLRREANNEE